MSESSSSFDCLFCLKKTSSLKNQLTADVLKDLELFQFFCKYLFRLENPYNNNNYDSDNSLRFNFDSIEGRMLPVCTKCANFYKQMVEFYSEFQELETQIKNVVEEFRQFVFSSESDSQHKDGFNTSDFHRCFRQHVLQRVELNSDMVDIKLEINEPAAYESEEMETADIMDAADYKTDPLEEHFDNEYDPIAQEEGFESEINALNSKQTVKTEAYTVEPRRSLRSRSLSINKKEDVKTAVTIPTKTRLKVTTATRKKLKKVKKVKVESEKVREVKKRNEAERDKIRAVRMHICPVESCKKEIKGRKALREHLKKHEDTTPEKDKTLCCPICQKLFAFQRFFDYHVSLHKLKEEKDKEEFFCEQCDRRCKTKETLDKHISDFHQRGIVKFVCTICGKQFTSPTGFKHHLKKHAGISRQYKSSCKYCPEVFRLYSQLKKHEFEKHPEHTEVYSCTICGMKFYMKGNFEAHLKTHSAEKIHGCEMCPEKFRTKNGLDSHYIQSHEKEPLYCKLCDNKKFTSSTGLRRHNQVHHNQGNLQLHSCPTCDKKFTSKHLLSKHMTVHGDERNHICEVCGKAFKTPDVLFNHKRSHAGGRRFNCEICNQTFTYSQGLTNHLKSHHGVEKSRNSKATATATTTTSRSLAEDLSTTSFVANPAIGSTTNQLVTNLHSEFPMQFSLNSHPFLNSYHF